MAVLLENHWQARKVRWITWGFFIWGIGWLYSAWTIAETFGIAPGDGGVLRPPAERYAMAGITAAIGLLPLVGMLVFSRLYLMRIEREGDAVLLIAIGILSGHAHVYRLADIRRAVWHPGRRLPTMSRDTPWMSLSVARRRLPFIVDMQAEHADRYAIQALAKPRTPTRRERRRDRRKA